MDLEKLKAKLAATKASMEARQGKGDKPIKPPGGKSRWRILPGWDAKNPENFSIEIGEHWIKDSAGKVLGVIVCERDTFGQPCPVCDAIWTAIKATTDDEQIKALKEMLSKRSFLFNALRVDGADASPTEPKLLALPPTAAGMVLDLVATRLVEDDVNLLDLSAGYDIFIEKTGTGFDTKYSVMDAKKSTPVDPAAMKNVKDLAAYVAKQKADGERKGLGIVRTAVSGLLSAPGEARMVTPPRAAAPSVSKTIDVEDVDVVEIAEERAVKATPPRPAPVEAIAPDDLDALLADLNK